MIEDALVPDPQSNESDAMAVRLVEWNIAMGLPKKADLLACARPAATSNVPALMIASATTSTNQNRSGGGSAVAPRHSA